MDPGQQMRLFRLFVVFATLVSLPGYGLAATGHAGGCPERAAGGTAAAAHAMDMAGMDMSGMVMPGMHGAGAHHDCCPGTANPKANPKPASSHDGCPACIAGHACQGSHAAQPGGELTLRVPPLRIAMGEEPATGASLCGPDDLLRPPRHS